MDVWYFGCVGCVSSTCFCHFRRHSRCTHSFDPLHMHGAMRSPSALKQKRHTDSHIGSRFSSSPAAPAAPPPSRRAKKSSRQMAFLSLWRRDAAARRSRSAVDAATLPIAALSSYMKDWRPTSSVSTDQLGFHVSGW